MFLSCFGRTLLNLSKRTNYIFTGLFTISLFSFSLFFSFNKDHAIFPFLYSNAISGNLIQTSLPFASLRDSLFPNRADLTNSELFFCDRSDIRSDVCLIRGDIRFNASSLTLLLLAKNMKKRTEGIQPYPRKFDLDTLLFVNLVTIVSVNSSESSQINFAKKILTNTSLEDGDKKDSLHFSEWAANFDSQAPENDSEMKCEVLHTVPGLLVAFGGWTGNPFHNVNEILIPLFIATHHLKGEVVFIIVQDRPWWWPKYGDIMQQLSHYPPVIMEREDNRIHCFSEVAVGSRVHDDMFVNASLMPNGESIRDFGNLIMRTWVGWDHGKTDSLPVPVPVSPVCEDCNPRMTIVERVPNRHIVNLQNVTALAQQVGFEVQIMDSKYFMEPREKLPYVVNASVLVGVHGADITNFIFMPPGSVVIQIILLGTHDPSRLFFGDPAVKAGYRYIPYFVDEEESSLKFRYPKDHWVFSIRESFMPWGVKSKTFMVDQDATLNLTRLENVFLKAKSMLDTSHLPRN